MALESYTITRFKASCDECGETVRITNAHTFRTAAQGLTDMGWHVRVKLGSTERETTCPNCRDAPRP